MKRLSFAITPEAGQQVDQVVRRAVRLARQHGRRIARLDLSMDLIVCHANGCPLDFGRLLTANDADFGHDVFGIHRHLNRDTGELENGFRPRCAQRTEEADVTG